MMMMMTLKKRTTLGILALSLFGSALALNTISSPVGAQTTTIAERAAVRINWATGGAANALATNPAIFTIQYESLSCVADNLIGGTLHKAANSVEDASLGQRNRTYTILPTHVNLVPTQTSGTQGDRCSYNLRVISNLHCSFTVSLGGVIIGSVAKTGNGVTPTQVLVRIRGKAQTTANFFQTRVSNLDNAADGELEWVNSSNVVNNIPDIAGVILGVATATACNLPPSGSGFSYLNNEPQNSVNAEISLAPRNNCTPKGANSIFSVPAGAPATLQRRSFDTNCTYSLSVSAKTSSALAGTRAQCTITAALYERTGTSSISIYLLQSSATQPLRVTINDTTGSVHRNGAPANSNIVHISLFTSRTCPQLKTLRLEYVLLDNVANSNPLRSTDVTANIVSVAGSSSACRAIPSRIKLTAASNLRAGVDNAVIVALVARPILGRSCSYQVTYPQSIGALSLAAEPGGNFITGTGTGTAIARPTIGALNSSAGDAFDGRQIYNAQTIAANARISFVYEVRRLPITVEAVYNDNDTFTSNDIVGYRISLVGACARYSEVVAGFLGGQGAFRSLRALPGKTLVFGPGLRDIESSQSQAGAALYEAPPVAIQPDGTSVSCSVQVQETNTPSGCTVNGANPRTITFAEGLAAFAFRFEHTCSATTGKIPRPRGFTG